VPLDTAAQNAIRADGARRRADELSQTSYGGHGVISGVANAVVAAQLESARNEQTMASGMVCAHVFDLERKLAVAIGHVMGLRAHGYGVVAHLMPLTELSILMRDASMLPTDQAATELRRLQTVLADLSGRLATLARAGRPGG
jgi:hypothetical protein